MNRICWHDMPLGGKTLRSGSVAQGECIRLVLPESCQMMWLQRLIPAHVPAEGREAWQVWLETDTASVQAGTTAFRDRVGIMLHQRDAMANLSLRENLLLPFLYGAEPQMLSQAEDALPEVAEFLGIESELDRQAGECSSYTHRLIGLGRCLLLKPTLIVAQDVHAGIAFEHLPRFRELFVATLKRLHSGLLYISSSEREEWDICFDRSLTGAMQ